MSRFISNMIFFRGKLTVNPNTLNNQIHTYFFAHYWQQQHTKELFQKKQKSWVIKTQPASSELSSPKTEEKLEYSYENWMKLINKVAEFNRSFVECYQKQYKDPSIQVMDWRGFRLFHDWDVWGDSTSYPQFKATAYFDSLDPLEPSKDTPKKSPFKVISPDMHLTTKMGTNKCIMAHQDTDSQDLGKIFGLNLNLDNKLKFDLIPFVNRSIHFRTVDTLPWSPSGGVHWNAYGHIRPHHESISLDSLEEPLKNLLYTNKKILSSSVWAEMRMLQYRYNHPTKVSSVIGYMMNIQNNKDSSLSFVNKYWRVVPITLKYHNPNPAKTYNNQTNEQTRIQVFLRNVTYGNGKYNGILIDLSGAILDGNNNQLFPLLPHQLSLTINTKNIKLNQEQVKTVFHQHAGMHLVQNASLQEGKQIQLNLSMKVHSDESNYSPPGNNKILEIQVTMKKDQDKNGCEKQYNIEIKDKFAKTKEIKLLNKNRSTSDIDDKSDITQIFQKSVFYDLYVTSFGKPYTGTMFITVDSEFNVDDSGLMQYTTNEDLRSISQNKLQTPKDRINKLLNDSSDFKAKYKDLDFINQTVYQGKLDAIIQQTDIYVKKLLFKENEKNKLIYTFQKQGKKQPFKLSFQEGKQADTKKVAFKDGYASVQVFLNENLTNLNNPRSPALQSLCLAGAFSLQGKAQQSFTAMFYQNSREYPYKDIDWLNKVGPKLKLMGLMYPSMQKIVDLYNYDGLSMNAMKRAFEIQDENHSRYMPATRQMSSVTHRQIRRWLYNPLYDASVDTYRPSKNANTLDIPDFDTGKKALVQLLKQAFKIQLTTIPLYLSALFSIKKEIQVKKLIRSVVKDQMKHLFIVSNLINALGGTPPYPLPSESNSDYIPEFPLNTYDPKKGLICFNFQHPQNAQWRKRMQSIPIQSSIEEQLLRFIMIEMPAQAYEIQIDNWFCSPVERPSKKGRYIRIENKQEVQEVIDHEYSLYKQTLSKEDLLEYQSQIENHKEEDANRYKTTFERVQKFKEAVAAVTRELQFKKSSSKTSDQFLTIGMAYEKITDYLWALSDFDEKTLFNGNNRQQFSYMYLQNMTQIINHRTAMEQIRQIILEGQGSSIFNVKGEANTSSHFVKFVQIYTGCDVTIESQYIQGQRGLDGKQSYRRKAKFIFTPNYKRFPTFPNYSKVLWSQEQDQTIDKKVNSQLQYERLSDRLVKTQFPNTFAPRSFLNGYKKILEELGFIFRTLPWDVKPGENRKQFQAVRLQKMENAVAKMRQMTLNAGMVVHPNNTYDQKEKLLPPKYPSASPKYNIKDSSYLPPPIDPQDSTKKSK